MRSLFEISKSGLRAAERSLSVTANNIVNADTPGYSRQRVDKSPIGMQMENYHAGLGVNITSVSRLRNEMNDVLLNEKEQDMGYLQGKSKVFEQLEASMASDSGGDLDLRIGHLFDSFSELASDPQDISVRNNLLSEAQQLTNKMGDMSRSIDRTSDLVRDEAGQTVESINGLLEDLNSLNSSITLAQAKDNPDNASLDMRVKKLSDLSKLVDFDSQLTDTGAVEIRIGGIQVLDENQAYKIHPDIDDVNKTYGLQLENGTSIDASGGRLGAQIEMYSQDIPDLKTRLDNVASTMVDEFNAVHSSGYGLDDSTSRNFFDPTKKTAAGITVNPDLIDNPQHIAASSVAGEAGNGDIATQMADLRNQDIIGDGGSKNRRLVDYAVDLISEPGSRISELNSKIEARDSEIQMLKTQQEREAGVNIDEELSHMIEYQNAYQGAARVMSAAQQMLDTLISIV